LPKTTTWSHKTTTAVNPQCKKTQLNKPK